MLRILAIFLTMLLVACTQATPTVVLSPEPLGEPRKSGEFANINVMPQGQTAQITPAERARVKAQLVNAGQQAATKKQNTQAQGASAAEIARLRRLALAERRRRLAEIAATNREN